MDRSVKIKTLTTEPKGRTISISDIHANLDLYLALLKKIDYQPNVDRLIILGDFIEKGPKNLETLHYLMKQSETEDVHCVMGNCDFTCKNVFYSYRLNFLKHILILRKESVIHEMANKIGLDFNEDTDMEMYCHVLRKHFLKELSFVNDCPHIVETNDTIYSHAALVSPDNYGDDFKDVINEGFFLKKNIRFHKRVVVGHMPVTEYCHRIADFNPLYDPQMNVYSIDGGNVVKKQYGQMNALMIKDNRVTSDFLDFLPEVTVVRDVEPNNPLPLFVTWNNREIQILKKEEFQTLVYSQSLNRKFYVDNEFVIEETAGEYTNYQMPLKKGEQVKVVFPYGDKVQIKKNGILGWTYRSNLQME